MKTFVVPCVSTCLAFGVVLAALGCGEVKPAAEPDSVMTRNDSSAGAMAVAPVPAPPGGMAASTSAATTTTQAPSPTAAGGTTTQSTTTTTVTH